MAGSPAISTSRLIHRAAASLDDGASARFAARPNSTRSAESSRPFRSLRIADPMPSWDHTASSAPGAAQRPGLGELQAFRRRGQRRAGVQEPGDGRDQPLQRLPVRMVLAAEVVHDPLFRPPQLRVPHVVGELQELLRSVEGGHRVCTLAETISLFCTV